MNTRQLYYFAVIAESASITLAAKKLNLSQPPLSKQILLLEQELGTKLFERSSKKMQLTEAGTLLYYRAKDILSMMDLTIQELKQLENGLEGTLKLGTISSSGNILINTVLTDFCKEYPMVNFEIQEGNTYELLDKLKNGMIEAAVVRTPFNAEGFECIFGREEPLAAVGKAYYFDNISKKNITLPELTQKPLVYYRRFDSMISSAFQALGLKPNAFCKNDDARTSLLWANAGLGIALVPESISNIIPGNDMLVKPIQCENTTTKIAAIYKKEGYVSSLAKSFVQYFGTKVNP